MGFAGSLEDVRPVDVLQVLSITQQTGSLVVTQPDQRAELAYVDGRIVTAQVAPQREHLAGYLLRRGWIDFATLHEALHRQTQQDPRPLVGQVLLDLGAVTLTQLQEGLECHVRSVVSQLLGWDHGELTFETRTVPCFADAAGNPANVSVLLDYDELGQMADQAQGRSLPEPEPPRRYTSDLSRLLDAAIRPSEGRLVVIVTEDVLVRYGLEVTLHTEPFYIVQVSKPSEVNRLLLASEDPQPTVIVDLDTVGRRSNSGSDALLSVRRLRRQWPNVTVLSYGRKVPVGFYPLVQNSALTFHLPRPDAVAERELSVVQGFVEALARVVAHAPRNAPRAVPTRQQIEDAERWRNLHESVLALRRSTNTTNVALQVLQFAASELERAVLLVVHEDKQTVVVHGMFGVRGRGLQSTRHTPAEFTLGSDSVLRQVLKEKRVMRHSIGEPDSTVGQLLETMGIPARPEAYFVPLVVYGRTFAIVYADNGECDADLPPAAALGVLAEHTSQVLENLVLNRRLQERDPSPGADAVVLSTVDTEGTGDQDGADAASVQNPPNKP